MIFYTSSTAKAVPLPPLGKARKPGSTRRRIAVMLRQRKQIGFAKLLEENGGTKAPPYEIIENQERKLKIAVSSPCKNKK